MENASKALIIAGAILISILLISVGIIVMNTINEPVDEAGRQADQQAVEMFNSKFTGYGGTDQRAASVKALINAAKAAKKSGRTVDVLNNKNGTAAGNSVSTGDISASKKYTVDFKYDDEGYINAVIINE